MCALPACLCTLVIRGPVQIPAPDTTAAILESRRIRKGVGQLLFGELMCVCAGLRVLAQLYSDQATRFLNREKFDAAQPLLQRALVMVEVSLSSVLYVLLMVCMYTVSTGQHRRCKPCSDC